jgi:hypothetical protein
MSHEHNKPRIWAWLIVIVWVSWSIQYLAGRLT